MLFVVYIVIFRVLVKGLECVLLISFEGSLLLLVEVFDGTLDEIIENRIMHYHVSEGIEF